MTHPLWARFAQYSGRWSEVAPVLHSAWRPVRRWAAGSTTERKTPTSHFEDASRRCSVSAGCERYRSSHLFMLRSTPISTRNAPSPHAPNSSSPAAPLSPSGAVSAPNKAQCPVIAETSSHSSDSTFHPHVLGRPGSMTRINGIAVLEAKLVWGRLLGEAAER